MPQDGSSSSQASHQAPPLKSFQPSNMPLDMADGPGFGSASFLQSNGFMAHKSATLPPLPLPVLTPKSTPSPMKSAQSRLPMPPQCGTAISQLPLPSTSPVIDSDEELASVSAQKRVQKTRPKIIGKTTLPQQKTQIDPRCVDVFDIISQIGEGTYGQVYKAKDTDNT